MLDTKKHCNDVSSGAWVEFNCDECDRKFTTKQGRNLHKTVIHKKTKDKKEDIIKRNRSVEDKPAVSNFKCDDCHYSSRSKWALKAHITHKHKEPTSPNEKIPRVNTEVVEVVEVAEHILSELFQSITEHKKKTTIEPTKDFLTNTAETLAEMLDGVPDKIDDIHEGDNEDSKEFDDILNLGNKKVVDDNLEATLVTLPLKDVEELRLKLRNLEDIKEDLTHKLKDMGELSLKIKNLEDSNKKLANKLTDEKNKNRDHKKNKEPSREQFIVIDMETNDEEENIEQLKSYKESGYSRSSPVSEPQKKRDVNLFECNVCDKKFNKREHMSSHEKTHQVTCSQCDKMLKNDRKLREHVRTDHDEMICHMQCVGGTCTRSETVSPQVENPHKCNFCDNVFPSRNALSTHRSDVHRTYKPCRDITNCQYQAGCYFSHIPVTLGKVRCYQCGEEFNTRNTMMIHRKIHGGVNECRRMITNECFKGDNCWWSHVLNQQVFQKVQENLPPPIQRSQLIQQQPQMTETIQNKPNEVLVKMLKEMNTELKKIKEILNLN